VTDCGKVKLIIDYLSLTGIIPRTLKFKCINTRSEVIHSLVRLQLFTAIWSSASIFRAKMKAAWSSELLVSYCVTTWFHIPEDHALNSLSCVPNSVWLWITNL